MTKIPFYILIGVISIWSFLSYRTSRIQINESKFITHIIDPKTQELKFYWKTKNNARISNFKNLKIEPKKENKGLIFATNWKHV